MLLVLRLLPFLVFAFVLLSQVLSLCSILIQTSRFDFTESLAPFALNLKLNKSGLKNLQRKQQKEPKVRLQQMEQKLQLKMAIKLKKMKKVKKLQLEIKNLMIKNPLRKNLLRRNPLRRNN